MLVPCRAGTNYRFNINLKITSIFCTWKKIVWTEIQYDENIIIKNTIDTVTIITTTIMIIILRLLSTYCLRPTRIVNMGSKGQTTDIIYRNREWDKLCANLS